MSLEAVEECEQCGDGGPLRHIRMRSGPREMLCEDCFKAALADRRVHPNDERIVTAGGDGGNGHHKFGSGGR